MVRKADRKAVQLHSAGLTNKPAIAGMTRVAASVRLAEPANALRVANPEEVKGAMERLRELLGAGKEVKLSELLQAAIKALETVAEGEETQDEKPQANRVPAAGTRAHIIAKARGEYCDDESLKVTNEEAFVSLRLTEHGQARLSADEAREYGLIVA